MGDKVIVPKRAQKISNIAVGQFAVALKDGDAFVAAIDKPKKGFCKGIFLILGAAANEIDGSLIVGCLR